VDISDYVIQMSMNYQALQDADEETRTTTFKKIEADLEDGLTVNNYQLPIATRMRQGTEQLTNIVRAILFSNSQSNIDLLGDSLFEV
jgi:serine/threonine protein phosphatase PrpC